MHNQPPRLGWLLVPVLLAALAIVLWSRPQPMTTEAPPPADEPRSRAPVRHTPPDTTEPEEQPQATDACPVRVRVLTPAGEPAADTALSVSIRVEVDAKHGVRAWSTPTQSSRTTDTEGWLMLSEAPCGIADLVATQRPYLPERHRIDTLVETEAVVTLRAGTWVHGAVTDVVGAPLIGAALTATGALPKAEVSTTEGGTYGVMATPGAELHLRVTHPGHLPERRTIAVPEGAEHLEVPIAMDDARDVRVRCLGTPDDSCTLVGRIACGVGEGRRAHTCEAGDQNEPVCACPIEDATVRAGTVSADVAAAEDTVVLDFTDASSLTAQVRVNGHPPQSCHVYIGDGYDCDESGQIRAHGIPTGFKIFLLKADHLMVAPDVPPLQSGHNDLGVIDLESGTGRVEGVVIDHETGEGIAGVKLELGGQGKAAAAVTGGGGEFALDNLDANRWSVFLSHGGYVLAAPLTIHLEDDETVTVEIAARRRSPAPIQDFDTRISAAGHHEEVYVEPDSPADAAGVQAGDRLVGHLKEAPDGEITEEEWGSIHHRFSFEADVLIVERDGETLHLPGDGR